MSRSNLKGSIKNQDHGSLLALNVKIMAHFPALNIKIIAQDHHNIKDHGSKLAFVRQAAACHLSRIFSTQSPISRFRTFRTV
jgi:hypothetical protein